MPNPNLRTFRMYPRGFFGADTGVQVEHTKPTRLQAGGPDLSLLIPSKAGQPESHRNVEELYRSYIDHPGDYDRFEFRERMLAVAFDAFGTDQFDSWFRRQYDSPAMSELHSRFLDDTLHYIETGTREMKPLIWARFLDAAADTPRPDKMSDVAKSFFFSKNGKRIEGSGDLEKVLARWLSYSNGVDDLIGTLMVLFGRY